MRMYSTDCTGDWSPDLYYIYFSIERVIKTALHIKVVLVRTWQRDTMLYYCSGGCGM